MVGVCIFIWVWCCLINGGCSLLSVGQKAGKRACSRAVTAVRDGKPTWPLSLEVTMLSKLAGGDGEWAANIPTHIFAHPCALSSHVQLQLVDYRQAVEGVRPADRSRRFQPTHSWQMVARGKAAGRAQTFNNSIPAWRRH